MPVRRLPNRSVGSFSSFNDLLIIREQTASLMISRDTPRSASILVSHRCDLTCVRNNCLLGDNPVVVVKFITFYARIYNYREMDAIRRPTRRGNSSFYQICYGNES